MSENTDRETPIIPSLGEVRADYIRDHTRNFDSYLMGRSLASEQEFYGEKFDRWLAAYTECIRAEQREAGRISIPRPHVPFGPKGIPEHIADAAYLTEAASHIEGGYPVGGSNLTATVIRLLRDAAAAIREAGAR